MGAGLNSFGKTLEAVYRAEKQKLASNLKVNSVDDLSFLHKVQAGIDSFKKTSQMRIATNPELKKSVMGDRKNASWADIGESMLKNRKGEYQTGRIAGVAAGTMVAGAVGVRAATGGGWAVNSNGQRDLVGVPFI